MNVALVTETFPPEVNGVAMTLSRLTRGLAARGHHVEVIRPRQRSEMAVPPPPGSASEGIPGLVERVVPGMPIPFYDTLRMGLPARNRLYRQWAKSAPDVVHVATEGPLGWSALSAARRLNIPVTSTFHTNFHAYGGHYGLRVLRGAALRYLRWFHNRTACTLVPTQEGVDHLAQSGFCNLGVLSRGVDATLFSPKRRSLSLREEWGAQAEDPVAIYVGRLAAEKNLGLAVDTFLALQTLNPRTKCVFVGDGPERDERARRYPQFIWSGVRRGEDLARHYASADVFVFPSTTETFGNVVTEAMASGLVVVAYDYASTRQHVVDGVNGYRVPFDQAAAFVARATAVLQQQAAWPEVRAAARATAVGLSWDSIIDQFAQVLATAGKRPALRMEAAEATT
ncbi:MAG TPA: glycosyltransferase family 1 protein [Opitutaceae bacterium]|nr:glycosyltransferase family 1 protein [Opitutaceae bacterium]